ncbi:hypothetical protein ONZ51_g9608 [Trametes cubensis]|uniref:ER-bound oxygenase mpaB/mpaB'/Rubber oxygenase catalytic domain-containing protein n=1 Tax=Trametes cubensis TaxID=1111947 RepID=A0AAD7TNJ8_9APHY|nr:hypothetical protein ONZ51_g9608 [Trametes cubensis]
MSDNAPQPCCKTSPDPANAGSALPDCWRNLADPACDHALRQAFNSPSASVGSDLLRTLEFAATSDHAAEAVRVFLDEVQQEPPPGLLASEEEIALAQDFFLDNSIQIMQALLHYSLAGGFASPRIVRTLEAVSYLVPHVRHVDDKEGKTPADLSTVLASISKASSDRTMSRLSETFQFVLDVMGCSVSTLPSGPTAGTQAQHTQHEDHRNRKIAYLLPGGEGWKSAVRVRLLHGIARWRTGERWERGENAQPGVPISQEDMAATLAAFSTIPIWCLHRLNLPPSPAQASAYLALWRHVGFYLGVSPSILLRYFSNTGTTDKFLATAALHLFSDDTCGPGINNNISPTLSPSTPNRTAMSLRRPTIPILVAVSNRPPLNTSLEYNIALTTHLLGPSLSARLGLPPTSLRTRLRVHAFLFMQRLPHYFAQLYQRKGWHEKRRALYREGLARSVWWNLGRRQTTFRPRTAVEDGGRQSDRAIGGELPSRVTDEESVNLDPARAQVLTKMWSEVWREMIVVSVTFATFAALLSYVGLRCLVKGEMM